MRRRIVECFFAMWGGAVIYKMVNTLRISAFVVLGVLIGCSASDSEKVAPVIDGPDLAAGIELYESLMADFASYESPEIKLLTPDIAENGAVVPVTVEFPSNLGSLWIMVVIARVSKSGNAMTQPGDIQGMSNVIKPGTSGLKLSIDKVIQ